MRVEDRTVEHKGIADPDTWNRYPKHSEAIRWLNSLIMDLKVQLGGGEPMEPITLERLAEFSKHREDLEGCIDFLRLQH